MPKPHKIREAVDRLAEFFENQRDGGFILEFADALEEVTKAVQEHRKGGKITVSIALSPIKKTSDAISVRDTIKVVVPAAEQPESLFFADHLGHLGIEHPSQRRLPGVERRPSSSDVGVDQTVDLRHAASTAEASLRDQGHDGVTVSAEIFNPETGELTPAGVVPDHGDDDGERTRPRVVGA